MHLKHDEYTCMAMEIAPPVAPAVKKNVMPAINCVIEKQ
jgi:hypothetical protein